MLPLRISASFVPTTAVCRDSRDSAVAAASEASFIVALKYYFGSHPVAWPLRKLVSLICLSLSSPLVVGSNGLAYLQCHVATHFICASFSLTRVSADSLVADSM